MLHSQRQLRFSFVVFTRIAFSEFFVLDAVWLNLFLAIPAMVAFIVCFVLYVLIIRKMSTVHGNASEYLDKSIKAKKQKLDQKNQRLCFPAFWFSRFADVARVQVV